MTRQKRDPLEDLVVTRKHPRWFVWRDVVTVLLAVAVVMLVRQVGDLRDRLDANGASSSRQISDLTGKVDLLTGRLTAAQQQNAAKDARIRQLTDTLLHARVPVPTATFILPRLAPTPSASPSAGPSPTAPQPQPTVTVTHTAPPPSPSPSPTRSCLLGLLC